MKIYTLKLVYFSLLYVIQSNILEKVNRLMKYLTSEKKIIRIMTSVKTKRSCRSLFRHLNVLLLAVEFLLLMLSFVENVE